MKKFSLANEEQLFVKKEQVEGTLVYPTATDMVLAVGAATTNQEIEFLDDAQVRARRSRSTPIKARTNPGSWSFNTYVKPSGVAGTKPETDVLWECLMGDNTPTPNVKIDYTLDSTTNLPSFSLLRKVGHTVFYMAGCTVNQGEVNVSGADIASVAWSGQFMKWYRAGHSILATTTAAPDDHIHVDDATRYTELSRVTIGSATNTGLGFLVTGVNYTTNTLAISPAVGAVVNSGSAVEAWFPANGVEVGAPVHGKLGYLTIDTNTAIVLSATITINNNIKYYTDLKNGLVVPTIYGAPGFRDVSGTLRLYFYKNMPTYFYRSDYQIQDALIVPAGSVAGKIMEISCPKIEYKTPVISGDEEIMIELPFTAVGGAAGDDEIKVTFK
jgi:hypothetical protein